MSDQSKRLDPQWVAQKLIAIEFMLKELLKRIPEPPKEKVKKSDPRSREPQERLLHFLDEESGALTFTRIPAPRE